MESFKGILSHLLAIVLFIGIMLLSGILLGRDVITYKNIYNSLESSGVIEDALNNNADLKNANIPEELLDYVDIDDILYEYMTNKFLYEVGVIKEEPTIDKDVLNERLSSGLDSYIDDMIDEYTGGLNSLLEDSGVDLGIREEVEKYISETTSIDLSSGEILSDEDIDSIYEYVDSTISDIKDSTYLLEIVNFIFNSKYMISSIVLIILSFALIGLINYNIHSSFAYSIFPCSLASIIYLIGYFVSNSIELDGGLTASVGNVFIDKIGTLSFKYFIYLLIVTFAIICFYVIIKRINIIKSHKSGVATLDTVFDDYDNDREEENNLDEEDK